MFLKRITNAYKALQGAEIIEEVGTFESSKILYDDLARAVDDSTTYVNVGNYDELVASQARKRYHNTGTVITPLIGDGKAEFLGEGTHAEFLESEKERKGFKGIFGL